MATLNTTHITRVIPDSSAMTTQETFDKLQDGTATYKNVAKKFGKSGTNVPSAFAVTDTGEAILLFPAGMPPDLLGNAVHQFNQNKRKYEMKERMLARLTAKNAAK